MGKTITDGHKFNKEKLKKNSEASHKKWKSQTKKKKKNFMFQNGNLTETDKDTQWKTNIVELGKSYKTLWENNRKAFFENNKIEPFPCSPDLCKTNFETIIDLISANNILWGELIYGKITNNYSVLVDQYPELFDGKAGTYSMKKRMPTETRIKLSERTDGVLKLVKKMKEFFRRSARTKLDYVFFKKEDVIRAYNDVIHKNRLDKARLTDDNFYKICSRNEIKKSKNNPDCYECHIDIFIKAFPILENSPDIEKIFNRKSPALID
jgi:hypothetical protein